MKKLLTLFALSATGIAGSLFFLNQQVSPPAGFRSLASSAAAQGQSIQGPSQGDAAASAIARTGTPAANRAPNPAGAIPRFQPGEQRFTRAELARVLPGLTAPIADWRRFNPSALTVVPLPGMPLNFTARSISTDGARTTWVGTNETQGATLVACATETLWDAIITVPGADEYSIKITPEWVRVFETSSVDALCGQLASEAHPPIAAATESITTTDNAAATTAGTTLYTADVLVLYDTGTKNDWGSTAETENRIAAVIAAGNTYLADSKVDNLQWHLAGTAESPAYPATQSLEDDLDRLADLTTELGRFARDQRTTYGADQVMLIVSGERDYAGIAHAPGHLSVVSHPGTSATAAHELAHNFGCHHDRETAEAADSDGRYYYGHRFTYDSKDVGTLMSYAAYYIPYFSNPSVSYEGIATGVESGQPKAADNARWLREHAENIATLMVSKTVATPTITSQPASVTITAGQSFTLSVTATGNALTYQWAKGGADIVGATSASYSKSTSTTADGGSYTVKVANTAGSVTSSAATLTVNAAATPSSSGGSSSGSSGGGGGAIGLLGTAAMLALLGRAATTRQ